MIQYYFHQLYSYSDPSLSIQSYLILFTVKTRDSNPSNFKTSTYFITTCFPNSEIILSEELTIWHLKFYRILKWIRIHLLKSGGSKSLYKIKSENLFLNKSPISSRLEILKWVNSIIKLQLQRFCKHPLLNLEIKPTFDWLYVQLNNVCTFNSVFTCKFYFYTLRFNCFIIFAK